MTEREALLAQLRDPSLPEIDWWPLAPGWWILAGLLTGSILLYCVSRIWRRHHRRKAWQRQARAELEKLRASLPDATNHDILMAASVLTRRILLAVMPRTRVAALHGDAWLGTLDRLAGGRRFSEGPGRWLATGPYQRDCALGDSELSAMLDAIDELLTNAGKREGQS